MHAGVDSREFNVLDSFLLRQHPLLPFWATVCHTPQDDLRDFQPGITETHCMTKSKLIISPSTSAEHRPYCIFFVGLAMISISLLANGPLLFYALVVYQSSDDALLIYGSLSVKRRDMVGSRHQMLDKFVIFSHAGTVHVIFRVLK